MRDLIPRTLTAVVMIATVIGLLVASKLWGTPWPVALLIGGLTWLGTLEVLDLVRKLGLDLHRLSLVGWNVAYAVSVAFFDGAHSQARFIPLLVFAAAILWPLAWYASRRSSFKHTLASWFALFYVPFLLQFAFRTFAVEPYGFYYLLLLVAGVWIYDIAAYFVGSAWGREKLFPEISAKKTWEGVLGGTVGVYAWLLAAPLWVPGITWDLQWLLLPLYFTLATQLGDLFESWIKRIAHVKDAGELLPGHGGLLDRIDGLLFASPVFYFYLREVLHLF